MSIAQNAIVPSSESTVAIAALPRLTSVLENLEGWFETELTIVDTVADAVVDMGRNTAPGLPAHCLNLFRVVASRGRPDFIAGEGALLAVAIPIPGGADDRHLAVGLFLSAPLTTDAEIESIAKMLGWSHAEVESWAARQIPWQPSRLLTLAEAAHARLAAESQAQILVKEDHELSANIAAMYEEISLLHRLTQHLRISESVEGLARFALEWLGETVPAESLVLELLPRRGADGSEQRGRSEPLFLTHGDCPFAATEFRGLVEELGLNADARALVINLPSSTQLRDKFPALRQAVLVPLTDKQNLFGWLAAFNHRSGGEFGSPEANLLGTVSTILAVHASNTDLYRQQAEFLASVVRALTSAIDAKDPYTCGHSDRVARIAVALATEMDCDRKQLDTVYLSGLLHDIGKIGIDDSVLRKTSKLTDAEYEHIKLHTDIGFKILCDLEQLGEVLPVVRYHHEAWNGAGYPRKLAGEQIPLLARIVAVADAFDAMSSDRPYRKGMPDERLDEIFRQGAGTQWDPRVVESFFRIRNQVGQIIHREVEVETVTEEVRQIF